MAVLFNDKFTVVAGDSIVGRPAGAAVWENGESSDGSFYSQSNSNPPRISAAAGGGLERVSGNWGSAARLPLARSLFDQVVTIKFRLTAVTFDNSQCFNLGIGVEDDPQAWLSVSAIPQSAGSTIRMYMSSVADPGYGGADGLFEFVVDLINGFVTLKYGGLDILSGEVDPILLPAAPFLTLHMANHVVTTRLSEVEVAVEGEIDPPPSDAEFWSGFVNTFEVP